MRVDGYHPDSIINYKIFNTEKQAVDNIVNNVYPNDLKRFSTAQCRIVNDDNICYKTGEKLEYSDYRISKLEEANGETHLQKASRLQAEVIDHFSLNIKQQEALNNLLLSFVDGNPVPSLDNLKNHPEISDLQKGLLRKIEILLQYGRETDKENLCLDGAVLFNEYYEKVKAALLHPSLYNQFKDKDHLHKMTIKAIELFLKDNKEKKVKIQSEL